jgi:DNA topoisomerase II
MASKKYIKKDQITHILDRPDMYVGSTRPREIEEYIYSDGFISLQTINISPALLRIFVEPLSNAVDNVERSKEVGLPCTSIKVDLNLKTGYVTVFNNGDFISITKNEEGNYFHSMVFGELLTSSNYDDEEERMVSGRNGVGVKLCVKKGTLVPDFKGNILKIEDVQIGDELIGDDGMARKVIAKTEGEGKLFRIQQLRGQDYIVNENHILSLCIPDHKVIFWNKSKNSWHTFYLDSETKTIKQKSVTVNSLKIEYSDREPDLDNDLVRYYKKALNNSKNNSLKKIEIARKELEKFLKNISDDNTIDISLKEYLSLDSTMKNRLSGFIGDCVQWSEKEVDIDPYRLGLWLGFSSSDHEIFEDLQELENDKLKKYDIIDNKHIPKEYLINSRQVRLELLAGLIDISGNVKSTGSHVLFCQDMNHKQLIEDIIFLTRSLGFKCSEFVEEAQWNNDGEFKKGEAISILISGKDLADIPTRIPSKKCANVEERDIVNTGPVIITQVEDGEFVGLMVDGNHRFVLEDFTVIHNCNVYSTHFKVEGYDPTLKKLFCQEWRNNMKETDGPVISPSKGVKIENPTKGFTRITYKADFERFGIKKYTQQIFDLFSKYVYDAAMLTKVKITLNGENIHFKNGLADYCMLYSFPEEKIDRLKFEYEGSEVVVTSSDTFEVISFVNGVYTSKGGSHVKCWTEAILRPIVKFYNDKSKNAVITIKDVRQFFKIFISTRVPNPEFESQEKHTLLVPKTVPTDFPQTKINILKKWESTKRIEEIIKRKEFSALDKTTAKTKRQHIPGLDHANKAGTKFSSECGLILCEGNSAKTYAVTGIEIGVNGKKGRDYWGVMPLRGKLLNVREKNPALIAKNQVITNLIQALGLKYNLDYSEDNNYKNLKYGKVMLLTDSDVDGIHISGLIMNVFHYLFPTLLEREPSFLTAMQTPIVRVFLKSSQLIFYDETAFKRYAKQQNKKLKVKYYKGLGTSNNKEVKETFGQKMIEFKEDEHTGPVMNKCFGKDTEVRKTWLTNFDPEKTGSYLGNEPGTIQLGISKFLNTELIKFSLDDCARSIPNLFDGLKQSQRKILYTCFSRNLNFTGKVIKVAQLSGSVAEKTSYHHGEQNLYTTITKMAQAFTGSNNIPLLYRDGQFGSRIANGSDAASARYIFTKLEALTRLIFRSEDDILLKHLEDDGEKIEPECYVPILPMILINGSSGIGTGWSCNVPCFNPLDIIDCIKIWLENEGKDVVDFSDHQIKFSLLPELVPWYRGFTGKIEGDGSHKFISYGVIESQDIGRTSKKVVTELPIGMSIEKFKEFLESLEDNKSIKKFDNYSKPNKPHFVIQEHPNGIECTLHSLKLQTILRTSNIVLFLSEGKLKKFETIDEVIDTFCGVRYKLYGERKKTYAC